MWNRQVIGHPIRRPQKHHFFDCRVRRELSADLTDDLDSFAATRFARLLAVDLDMPASSGSSVAFLFLFVAGADPFVLESLSCSGGCVSVEAIGLVSFSLVPVREAGG